MAPKRDSTCQRIRGRFRFNELLVAPAAQLVHLLAQGLGALGGLRRLRDLALQLRDARVALDERRLVVRAGLSGAVVGPGGRGGAVIAAHLRRRALRFLRRALADLLRLVLQAIYLPVLPVRRAKKQPVPIRWVQAMGVSQEGEGSCSKWLPMSYHRRQARRLVP